MSGGGAGRKKNAVGSDPLAGLDRDRLSSLMPGSLPRSSGHGSRTDAPVERKSRGEDPIRRGREALADGRLSDARSAFEQALGRGRDPAALVGLSEIHVARKEHALAVKRLEEAASIAPDDVDVAVRLGRARIGAASYLEAEEVLKRAIRLAPESAEARCEMGILMTKKGLYDDALAQLERAIDLEPESGRAHFYLGVCHNQRDRLDEASRAFQRAVEIDPDDDRAWYHLGIVHDRRGSVDRAREMYRRARQAGETRS